MECEVPGEHPVLNGKFARHHLRTPAEMLMEEPYDWCRPLTDGECANPYLVVVDLNMSFAAAANGLTVGLNGPTRLTGTRSSIRRCLALGWWTSPTSICPASRKAATTDGLVVSTRARFGFTAAAGTTDDARIRDITQALPPEYADRLFTAREQGATEQQFQQIAADGLAQMYFRANNSRAYGLGVEFTDVDRLDIEV
ncbi:telomere-protecting terminal protein Tpg [Streptomyces sp. NPDC001443]|uniref:telomere-protecting terminal protein Tpg n=1 Tax=Streptomyces sp. NPDC059696 TaxID=3346911 RepID=UPI00369445C4